MPNNHFTFKQFTIFQERSAFKVGTDAVLLGTYADIRGKKHILDIGTGTGVIALMLAQRSDAEIFAIEPDRESFNEAAENFSRSKWSGRIRCENSLLQNYFPGDVKFDLIVTNPPYFVGSLKNPDPVKSRTRHDITLNHRDILEGVDRLLGQGGTLQLILPYAEGNVFIAEAGEFGFFCNDIVKIRSAPTSEIRRLILTYGRERKKVTERFLTVESGKRHDFTDEYKELTKDFYLKF